MCRRFVLQFALAAGATVIVTSSSDDKLKLAEKLGAHHGINYVATPNWDEEVMKIVRRSSAASSRGLYFNEHVNYLSRRMEMAQTL
jgi:NADPH:quinone reductase-like Zn-dependent oxidoreductase